MFSSSRILFLLDGLGALLSAFFLGIVLVRFEVYFGIPKNILYLLAGLACILMIYSLGTYLFAKDNWHTHYKTIAFANLAYCFLTAGLIIYFHKEITPLGLLYFLAEMAILLFLVKMELKSAKPN